MGQVHSDQYTCDAIANAGGATTGSARTEGPLEDVGDSELCTDGDGGGGGGNVAECRATCGVASQFGTSNRMSATSTKRVAEQQHVRKLSNVSHRNIQLLSMRPRSEKDAYADDLRTRRRSSLINLILGAPSSGPRFCDDLCSLSSHITELGYFGIESFPSEQAAHYGGTGGGTSSSSLRLASIEDIGEPQWATKIKPPSKLEFGRARRLSIGSLQPAPATSAAGGLVSVNPLGRADGATRAPSVPDSKPARTARSRNPSLASTLASIDLTSSFEQHQPDGDGNYNCGKFSLASQIPLPISGRNAHCSLESSKTAATHRTELIRDGAIGRAHVSRGRINQRARMIRRTGSELSLYSTVSASSSAGSSIPSRSSRRSSTGADCNTTHRETKLIILLQVALPFILAGFGNMAAGLVLDLVSQRRAFASAPIFFVLLPPLVGLKGNIEMTLASRLSTLSNLNLLQTNQQRGRAYASNLTLVISQAIGLSLFAAAMSILCELYMFHGLASPAPQVASLADYATATNETTFTGTPTTTVLPLGSATLAVFASALATVVVLVIISSVVMPSAVALANLIQVNPDNLSTLIAALYGDVSCVFTYGLMADWMFSLMERNLLVWPTIILTSTLLLWPISLYVSYKFEETHHVALYSMPPMTISIMISMGSGALLSLFVGKFRLIALYQPVVNGFGANLVAVQASRVSTWLWCSALDKMPPSAHHAVDGTPGPGNGDAGKEPPGKLIGSLASFEGPKGISHENEEHGADKHQSRLALLLIRVFRLAMRCVKLFLWSFCNSTPNAIAARMLLLMLIPAHTIYFSVIWLVSPANHVLVTWPFYTVYIGLCLVQVFVLLTICEPFMSLLMSRKLDPDVFGISILMAVADLTGTICLTLAFFLLASIGDVNSLQ